MTTLRCVDHGVLPRLGWQPAEAAEYRDYIAYLHSLGSLHGEVENLELEELQGVPGLRALRVAVDFSRARIEPIAPLLDAARAALPSRS